jgi:hypothetical protein
MKKNPIADAIPISDIGAHDIEVLMLAARKFPQLHAYDSPDGRHILIAVAAPTKKQIAAFFRQVDAEIARISVRSRNSK